MRITSIDTGRYRVPLAVPLSDSIHGAMPFFELVTVRVRTADGPEGLGYTYTVGHGGVAVEALLRHELPAVLLGGDALRHEHLWRRMQQACGWIAGGALTLAISAVDIALWDLKGKAAGLPLWRLLGGARDRVPCYAGGVDLQFSLDELRAQADRFRADGFRAIKMKVGRADWREDVERVAALRAHLGPHCTLMVDANTGYSLDAAVQAARAFAPYGITWFEEPTAHTDYEGHRRIQQEGGLPVATGENLKAVHEFREFIVRGALTFPQPDITNLGGITPWLKVAHLAEAHNLPMSTHGVHDIQVHLLAAIPNASWLEMHLFAVDTVVEHPFRLVDGHAVPPDRPGHGVAFLWDKLEPLRA